jgi:hypothetical protein
VADHVRQRSYRVSRIKREEVPIPNETGDRLTVACHEQATGSVHGVVEVIRCCFRIEIRPQRLHHLFPVQAKPGSERQEFDERRGPPLATAVIEQCLIIATDAEPAQKLDAECNASGHFPSVAERRENHGKRCHLL